MGDCSQMLKDPSRLILEELRMIRSDVNTELKNIKQCLDNILMSKIVTSVSAHSAEQSNYDENSIDLHLYGYDSATNDESDSGQWPETFSNFSSTLSQSCVTQNLNLGMHENISTFSDADNEEKDSKRENKSAHMTSTSHDTDSAGDDPSVDLASITNIKKRKRKPPLSKSYPTGQPWQCSICFRTFEEKKGLTNHSRSHKKRLQIEDMENVLVKRSSLSDDSNDDGNSRISSDDPNPQAKGSAAKMFHAKTLNVSKNSVNRKNKISKQSSKKIMQFQQRLKDFKENVSTTCYCPVCGKKFPCCSSLRRHILTHTKPYRCYKCCKGFSEKRLLASHSKLLANCTAYRIKLRRGSSLRVLCKICGDTFHDSRSLEFHISSHLQQKPVACTICKAMFSCERTLKKHLREYHCS